ncbi:MFS transporter [Filobacillus milosensis]|uniref:MFS transporter n=1 Tax=Filobacillus milosensis TaxID=94137 RepID=A0A4Y8IN65_9BACI|nr:MFS transporter [Filobacillus milosensis]TFB21832.1 MFS transporter [Filobacillus milosensis]
MMGKKLKLIWGAFFLAEFGRTMYFIIVTWLLYSLTNDALYTGLLVSIGFIPSLIMNLIFGVIVDRMDRKYLTILANIINTMTIVLNCIAILVQAINPWIIIVTHMIIQLMGSLFRPAVQAFIAESFPKDLLPKVFSQSGSAAIVGGLSGASIGGILIGVTSGFMSMIVVAISFAIATISLTFVSREQVSSSIEVTQKSIATDLIEGFNYLKRNTFMFNLFGVMFVGQLVFHTSVAFLSVYTKEYLEQTVTVYGFLDASLSLGGVIAGLLGTWWWNKSANHISSHSLVVVSIGLLLVGLAPSLYIAFIGVFLIGLGTTWVRVLLQSIQQMVTDKAYHGRMSSYRMICNQGSVVISAPILGWVANSFGANGIYMALLLPVSFAMLIAIRQSRQKQFKKVAVRKTWLTSKS